MKTRPAVQWVFAAVALCVAWMNQGASFQGLGDLPGGAFSSYASDISGDGQVIVGSSETGATVEGYRWTETEGMVALGLPSSDPVALIHLGVVNHDGTVITGMMALGSDRGNWQARRVFYWTAGGGAVNLGAPPQSPLYVAWGEALTAEGDMIVVTSYNQEGLNNHSHSWTEAAGYTRIEGDLPGGLVAGFGDRADQVSGRTRDG